MTESQWLTCTDPEQMFRVIGDRDTVRQARCVLRERLLPLALRDCNAEEAKWVRTEIDVWVDDLQNCVEAPAGSRQFPQVLADRIGSSWPRPDGCRNPGEPRDPDRCKVRRLPPRLDDEVKRRTCCVLRDLFGPLLFRTITLELSWQTSSVMSLAEGIYQDRVFDRMPILADALQDAGCDNADILSHCRQAGEHVRGCWVIDLLTGRK